MRSAAVLDRVEAAASGQDTDDLLVLWQRPSTREIVPIGRFSRTANGYSFVYTRAAAEKRDFRPLLGLPDLHQRYDSQQIPAVFSQRVMSPSRSDYGKYLAMLGLSEQEQVTPWEQIVHSGGRRVGDTLQFMRVPVVRDGRAIACFLANGVRHIPGDVLRLPGRKVRVTREQQEAALEKLRAGDLVLLEPEQGNPEDDHAILVTSGGVPLGWVPGFCPPACGRWSKAVHVTRQYVGSVGRIRRTICVSSWTLTCKSLMISPSTPRDAGCRWSANRRGGWGNPLLLGVRLPAGRRTLPRTRFPTRAAATVQLPGEPTAGGWRHRLLRIQVAREIARQLPSH